MPAKMARSAPRPPSGLPELTVAVRTSLLSCGKARKIRVFTSVRESSGKSRLKCLASGNNSSTTPLWVVQRIKVAPKGLPSRPKGR
jgi:hypothetical protein